MATNNVVSLSSMRAAGTAATNAEAITARTTEGLSCRMPVTPGTELPSEMPRSMTVEVTRASPIP
jgi:hypothetical protein